MPLPIIALLGGVFIANSFAQSTFPPWAREIAYKSNQKWSNLNVSPADAIELRRRKMITREEFLTFFEKEGYDNKKAEALYQASKRQLTGEELLILKWRKSITEQEYIESMSKIGVEKEDAIKFEQARKYYPSPADLITFQAREVYEPDMIQKYGLDDEFERIELEPFQKAGMEIETVKAFWRAHWEHPSLQIVYEMYFRGLIKEDELWSYFRLVEIPPFWRDKLIVLSHPPYTRVDCRRMYDKGVLNFEELEKNYRDLGYDEVKAHNLALWSHEETMTPERDLTKTETLDAYEMGFIDRKTAKEALVLLGYDETESETIILLKEYKIFENILKDKIDTIKTMFKTGAITLENASAQLDRLDISAEQRDKIMAEMIRESQKEIKLPTKEDLMRFLKAKIISKDLFRGYMGRLGYLKEDIELYIKESYK